MLPIANPRLVRAVAASEAPVPPSATAKSVIPVTDPPVIVASPPTTQSPLRYKFRGLSAPLAPISYVSSTNIKFDVTLPVI